tara:strand:+ start:1829 stop:3070 length:1242 start_codon:yes stop_codon:yes gene_type:complete
MINPLQINYKSLINNTLLFLLILFIFHLVNEKPFIKFYKFPNFGDNYVFGIILVSFFLLRQVNIKLSLSDKLFIISIFYIAFLETFIFSMVNYEIGGNSYVLLRDLIAIYYVFKVLNYIEIDKKIDKLILYSSIIFIFQTITYFIIYLSFHHYQYQFEFINYSDAQLSNFFSFKIFFLFLICFIFRKKYLSLFFYISSVLILYYFDSRAQLLVFLIIPIFIFLSSKQKVILIIFHVIILVFLFNKEYIKSFKNTIYAVTETRVNIEKNLNNEVADTKTGDTVRQVQHAEINSTVTRIYHLERNFKNLKKNLIFGSGYNSLIQNKYAHIAKTCECGILHPVFAYGLVGQILVFVFMYYWFRDYRSSFNDDDKLIALFTFSLFCMLYILTLPLFPAWFGLGYYLITKIPATESEK